ncbi:MAG: methionyl aminopeptidase [Planctomycetota bacterium]
MAPSPDTLLAAGAALDASLACVRTFVGPGRSTREIDRFAASVLRRFRLEPAAPALADDRGRSFPGVCSVGANDAFANAPPSDRVVRVGDLVTLDLPARRGEVVLDAAVPLVVGRDPDRAALAEAAGRVLGAMIGVLGPGITPERLWRAGREESARGGVRLVRRPFGHGLGPGLHEPPALRPDSQSPIGVGCVLALEPVVTRGAGRIVSGEDGWSLRTADGADACSAEATVAVTRGGAIVVCGRPENPCRRGDSGS